ncbi:MAG: P1 family peptidase [Alphaproteobacteria bacterium]|nr:P1 family peptidase [Alphaproteobacteria bacterium]
MRLQSTGPKNLITDIDGLRVGNASDDKLKSGVTVLTADQPFAAALHVMGGAPGTRETDLLAPDKMVSAIDALVLSGGSAHGLDAASGVMARLHQSGRGFAVGDQTVPIVPAAILFDLLNGGDKAWANNPYADLGGHAYDAAQTDISLGSHGAGTGATTATVKGGLGSASMMFDNGIIIGALVVANPMGSVHCPDSMQFWGATCEMDGEYGGLGVPVQHTPLRITTKQHPQQMSNTVIGIVATNLMLDKASLTRLATAAHDGIARAIQPSHTPLDGDLIFAASTGQHDIPCDAYDLAMLGHGAALAMTRAICRGIWHAETAAGDTLPIMRDIANSSKKD